MSNKQAKRQIQEGKAEKAKFGNLIDNFSYSDSKFREGLSNPFADATNPFADLKNPFANQRVATASADFQREANAESFASILDAQVQGGGGAGQNATALARAAAQSNQGIAAGLQQQEQKLQQQAAQGQLRVDTLKGQGEQRRQQLVGQGEQYITGLAENRATAELQGLGARYAGAQQTINSGYESIAATNAAWIQGAGSLAGGLLSGAGSAGSFKELFSDHRLKENIEFDHFSKSGIPVYNFNYKGHSEDKFQGALSKGVPEDAVLPNHKDSGFDGVDYSKIDVDFKKLN